MNRICFSIATCLILTSCGDSPMTYQISGTTTFASGVCNALTVTRLKDGTAANVGRTTTIQPSLKSGTGSLYSDSTCTTLAVLNVSMASGSNSCVFYFKSSSAGTSTVSVTDVTNQVTDAATVTLTIQ